MNTFTLDALYNHQKDTLPHIWTNGHSTCNGMNDRIPEDEVDPGAEKYMMIALEKINLQVVEEGGKKKIRVHFRYNEAPYRLLVTDSNVRSKYLALPLGQYLINNPDLCLMIGLSHTHNGFRYKIVKSIIGI